ncbi:MAG: hypothetical protein QM642_12190, partial [Edaphocola sp.]
VAAISAQVRRDFDRRMSDSPVVILLSVTGIGITFSTFYIAFLFLFTGNAPQTVAELFDRHNEYKEGYKTVPVQKIAEIGHRNIPMRLFWELPCPKTKTTPTDWI